MNNDENIVSFELNEYDLNNIGVSDTFEPYTEKELLKNREDIKELKFKSIISNKALVFTFVFLLVIYFILKLIKKIKKAKKQKK